MYYFFKRLEYFRPLSSEVTREWGGSLGTNKIKVRADRYSLVTKATLASSHCLSERTGPEPNVESPGLP